MQPDHATVGAVYRERVGRIRLRLHLAQPDHAARKMNEAHEGGNGFLAAQDDAPEALTLVEEACDLMAFLVEAPINGRFGGSAWISLDLRGGAKVVGDEGAQEIGVISGIGDDVADALQAIQQRLGLGAIAPLAGRRMDTDRQLEGIDGCMQFGR